MQPVDASLPAAEKPKATQEAAVTAPKDSLPQYLIDRAVVAGGFAMIAGRYFHKPIENDVDISDVVLGVGVSAEVRLLHSHDGGVFAAKTFTKSKMSRSLLRDLKMEVELFFSLDSPNIAKLERVYETDSHLHLVMEVLEGGELLDRLRKEKRFSNALGVDATRQMLLAVSYLHSRQIVHRDLKLENFVYERQGTEFLKLLDFGVSIRWKPGGDDPAMSRLCGSQWYVAPEVLRQRYTEKADMWSIGIIVYSLLCGVTPWYPWESSMQEVAKKIKAGAPYYDPARFTVLQLEARMLVKNLLEVDIDRRLSACEALSHPWIRSEALPDPAVDPSHARALAALAGASRLRRSLLAAAAWLLPHEVEVRLRKQFSAYGVDRDGGVVTRLGLSRALIAAGVSAASEARFTAAAILDALDTSGKGELCFRTFASAAFTSSNSVEVLGDEVLRRFFLRLDADGDGRLSPDDVRATLGEAAFGDEGPAALREVSGVEASELVTFEAFCSYLRRPLPKAEESRT